MDIDNNLLQSHTVTALSFLITDVDYVGPPL